MLYCNTVTGPRHGAGQGVGHAGWRAWGAQAGGRRRREGGRARAGLAGVPVLGLQAWALGRAGRWGA